MQELTYQNITYVIESLKKSVKKGLPKDRWAADPNLRKSLLADHKSEIHAVLIKLRQHHKELLPFVKKIKLQISDITESSYPCALYLLLCQLFENWNSFFILIENGKSAAAANLLRMNEEAIELVNLFTADFYAEKDANLKKWFNGKIIDQSTCRERLGKSAIYPQLDQKKLSAHIYQMESQASHNGYSTILESISPFTEDFDFDGYSQFFHSLTWLKLGSLCSTNIALKGVYEFGFKSNGDFKKLDEILLKYHPDINFGIDETKFKDFLIQ